MASLKYKILVVEDDELSRIGHVFLLEKYGTVTAVTNKEDALKALEGQQFDLAWLDLNLDPSSSDLDGLDLIEPANKNGAYTVVLSGQEEDESIEESYKRGCKDFISKPFDNESLNLVMRKFEVVHNQGKLEEFFREGFITQDQSLMDQLQIINDVIGSDRPVYLKGPTGTGKTLIAELIHTLIFGDNKKFVDLNCSEVQDNLIESELFGHKKGAFTGADSDRDGKILSADGGTLFLDEIATMPLSLQQKLLKVLESKSFYPVGSDKPIKSNFRLISATCEDLGQLVKEGRFREDLYYRIEGFNIELKPLRERKGDIPHLIKHFTKKSKRRVFLSDEVKKALTEYSWPGNVRELQKCVEILQSKGSGIVQLEDLPEYILAKTSPHKTSENQEGGAGLVSSAQMKMVEDIGLKAMFEAIEEEIVEHFYKLNNEKVRQTLRTLKISNGLFYRILERIKGEVPKEESLDE